MNNDLIYVGKHIVKVIERKYYKGLEYVILSLGTHPCCYVILPKGHRLWGKTYWEDKAIENINVHGGITYTENHLDKIEIPKDSWVIGWDFAHFNDFMDDGWSSFRIGGKQWTLKELRDTCEEVIKQIMEE